MIDNTGVRGQTEAGTASRPDYPRMQSNNNTTTVLICPNEIHRRILTAALEAQHSTITLSLTSYPNYIETVSLAELDCDAFVIELDSDRDCALDLVESICSRKPSASVVVYSGVSQPDLLIASMRAGAREFLVGTI